MNKEHHIPMTIGILLFVFFAFIIGYVQGCNMAKGVETPKPLVNPSSLTRPIPQDWSEMQLAIQERDGRLAREAEEARLAEEKRLQELSERATANDSKQNGLSLSSSNEASGSGDVNPYYNGPRFVSRQFVYDLIVARAGCGWDCDLMLHIVTEHETLSLDTMADNGNGCWGLFQCNSGDGSYSREQLWNPYTNADVAVSKFLGNSYGPWGH